MKEDLPTIAILGTGGTIAGKAGSASATTGYVPGSATVEDLLASVPGLEDIANLSSVQVSNIGSEDMTDEIWARLVKETESQLKDPEVTGVVITHGTDTLEETAFMLNQVLKSEKPVVLVGSMRPATSISADGPMNLLNAAKVVVLNDEIHGARDVTKTNTTNCDTFASPRLGALGFITGGRVSFFKESARPHTLKTPFTSDLLSDHKDLPIVDIIYAHSNGDGRLIKAAVQSGAKGIIYAGMGNGSIHCKDLPELEKALEEGIPVVRASRCGSGEVVDSSPEWTEAGMINAGTLNPQKARVLLQLCLAAGYCHEKTAEVFLNA